MAAYVPDAGDIIKLDLDPRTGHGHGGWRPAARARIYNAKTRLAVVVPITNRERETTLSKSCSRPRSRPRELYSPTRSRTLTGECAKYTDTAPAEVMEAVLERLRVRLGLAES